MQLLPQAFPFEQTLQHAPLGSTDHSIASSAAAELSAAFTSGALDPAVVKQTVSSTATASLFANLITAR